MKSAVEVNHEELLLRFPRGDFTDTLIRGLVASKAGSAGSVLIRAWSEAEIGIWHVSKRRFDRYGRHVARLIHRAGRSVHYDGLTQRAAGKFGVPLTDPPKSMCLMDHAMVDGRGWLDQNGTGVYLTRSGAV